MTGEDIARGESVLRDIYRYLTMEGHIVTPHDSLESEDNFGEGQPTPKVRDAVLGTMLPDLFAGEIAAMGRLLVKMSAALSRRALAEQDVLVRCRDAANELRGQSLLLMERCTKEVKPGGSWNPCPGLDSQVLSSLLLELSVSLTEAAESLDERHSNG